MTRTWVGWTLLSVTFGTWTGCSGQSQSGMNAAGASAFEDQGGEGEPCFPNNTCDDGYSCEDGTCKRSSEGSGGTAAGTAQGGTNSTAGAAGSQPTGGQAVSEGGAGGEADDVPKLRPMPNPPSSGLPNPAAYDTSEPGVTFDKLTRLMWQADFSASFEDQTVDTYCDTLELGGYDDWRTPSRIELGSILDYDVEAPPLLDVTAFSGAFATMQPIRGIFPSASVVANNPQMSWSVDFLTGDTIRATGLGRLRCVRGEPLIPVFELGVGPLEGTVTDLTTGLIWQLEASASPMTWADANAHCASSDLGGFDDWRVPSLTELPLIIDDSVINPATASVFPAVIESFWTSSSPQADETTAWTMFMYYGDTMPHLKTAPNDFVRCVR